MLDPAYIRSWVDYYGAQQGTNPTLRSDPDYWVNKIKETGGWSYNKPQAGIFGYDVESNVAYWANDRFYRKSDFPTETGAEGGTQTGQTGGSVLAGETGTGLGVPAAPARYHKPHADATKSGERAVPRGTALGRDAGSSAYASAVAAAYMMRSRLRSRGTSATVLGGYGTPAPATRPARAGGY